MSTLPASAGSRARPIKIAILAMGGEGGGVLADWIVDLGEFNGYVAQTTSVPGVAQRTGATIYYVELFPKARAIADGGWPVLALMPLPGDVDVVIASELMEAGRAIQRGFVTPERTTLIASTHRVYSIAEKAAMGDGRVDSSELIAHARKAAKTFISFDMAMAAEQAGSVISAVLFGALSGADVLPFSRAQFEATIERGGLAVKASLRAFEAAYAARQGAASEASGTTASAQTRSDGVSGIVSGATPGATSRAYSGTSEPTSQTAPPSIPRSVTSAGPLDSSLASSPAAEAAAPAAPAHAPRDPQVAALLARVRESAFAPAADTIVVEGVRRLLDYQDVDYAKLYLDRLDRIRALPQDAEGELVRETARHLALWMSYEDTIRVADLKTRARRFARVKAEVRAGSQQQLDINEFMHPRLEEICETLPAGIGRWLQKPGFAHRLAGRFTTQGRVIKTSSLTGFLTLYGLARMRAWRRSTLRYQVETERIESWLTRIEASARINPALAIEVAKCQRLVKGYSETFARGLKNYETLMQIVASAGSTLPAATLRELRDAALADEHGHKLKAAIARSAAMVGLSST